MRCILLTCVCALLLCAQSGNHVWETRGFEAFRGGTFDSGGANLFVSRNGVVQTVHRFDVNNDGYFDLVFNNTHDLVYTPPSFEYRFRRGARTGAAQFQYPGPGAVKVRVADLNGDGFPELIIARGFDNSTRVMNSWIYWGSKEGWSDRFHSELSTPHVQDVCVADLNGDGRADLTFINSGNYGVNTSYVYWGGPGGYSHGNRTGFETPGANGCLASDLDGDGFPDLVVTAAARQGKIYWGLPHGPDFSAPASLPIESALGAARMGSRIVVATAKGPHILSIRRRNFQLDQVLNFEGGQMVAGDLNGDGAADIVVTRASDGRNWAANSRIFWGKLENGKEVYSESAFTDLPTLGAMDAAIADVDGDGFPDIVFANSRSDLSFDVESLLYWGGPEGFSPARRTGLPTHGAVGVAAAKGSVYFANSVQGRPIGDIDTYIYFGSKSGDYSTKNMQRLPTIGGYESCIADLNDDGYTDLVLVGSHEGDAGSNVGSYIYWGGKQGLSDSRRSELPTHGAIGCAIADLNQDGFLDIAFANMDTENLQIMFGGPDGFSAARETNLPVKGPRFPSIADLNKDGYLDLLVPSLKDGLIIFWGSQAGYSADKRTVLPGVGPVSQQIADLNGDGYLDIIVCNLMDEDRWFFQGINTQIYWGSAEGYSMTRRSELPSSGAHHAVVADFNRDGYLDIFVSNYQSEFTRSLDSHIYWGNAQANYSPAHRLALHNESAAGVVAADLNGDGWIDLAVSNHVENGDHHTRSLIFWNKDGTFDARRTTALPTVGPHMMTGVDVGNLYTRSLEETYISAAHDGGMAVRPVRLAWEGSTPFNSKLSFDVRGADSAAALGSASWEPATALQSVTRKRWWQYRARFRGGTASWPTLTAVRVEFSE